MDNVSSEFNKILDEFMSKMVHTFPEQGKLNTYYKAFKVAKTVNNLMPLQLFMGGCLNFKDQIKSRDEEFFKKRPEFVEKCNSYSSFSNDIGMVEYWDTISDTTKKSDQTKT